MSKKVRILSIDGGGIRGVLPGTILAYIESQLQLKEGPDVRLADYFELIAGTSTGGILSCAYVTPNEDQRPKLTAQEAVNLYQEHGDKIFNVTFKHKLRTLGGITDEKFSADELEGILKDYMGSTKLSEAFTPCLITAYDIQNRKAHFFTSADATSEMYDYYLRDVCRATSAAPTYFEAAHIKSIMGASIALVDGGVFANNPALCAYSEARTMDFSKKDKATNPKAKDMFLVSIGTGSTKKPYAYEKAKDWGMVQWIKPIIDIMMSGNSETVSYQLHQLFDTTDAGVKEHYARLEPEFFNASAEMDDASEENLNALKESGLKNVSKMKEQLDFIVDKLIENH